MSGPDAASLEEHLSSLGDRREGRGTIIRLAVAQALAGANSTVVYATGAIIGATLAPDKALATLPISIFVVGMAACILPTGMIARRYERRTAFLAGTGAGVLTGLVAALAVILGSFWLFCLATFFGGAYAAVVLSFRFAAADCVEPEWRPRALSIVRSSSADGNEAIYRVTGQIFFAPVDRFTRAFDADEPARRVQIDVSAAHFWDISAVSALDKIIARLRRGGTRVDVFGYNRASADIVDKFALHDKTGLEIGAVPH
jgi:hypothetical protein